MDQSHDMCVRDPYGDPGEVACCPLAQWQYLRWLILSLPCYVSL